MAIRLGEFLEVKLVERITLYGRQYTLARFADDIGIPEKTLSAMMRAKEAERIAFENLQALIRYFGREFTDEFGLTPPEKPLGALMAGKKDK